MSDKHIVVCAQMKIGMDTSGISALEVFKADPKIGFYSGKHLQFWYIKLDKNAFSQWAGKELGGPDLEVRAVAVDQLHGNRVFRVGSFIHETDNITYYIGEEDVVLTERQARAANCWYKVGWSNLEG